MQIKSIILSIFLTILSAVAANAAVNIHGQITDENNEPLEFVTVKIAGTAIGTTGGLDGKFKLSAPDADTIRLVFTCIGYEDAHRKLIKPKGEATVNVKMTPATYTLNAIEVTDFQKQTNTIQKIDNSSYKLAPDVTGGSVESLLTTMAGVNSSKWRCRVNTACAVVAYDENSVYINGIEVYRPQLVSSGRTRGLEYHQSRHGRLNRILYRWILCSIWR